MKIIKLNKKDYEDILSKYNIGKLVSYGKKTKAFDTAVYPVKATKGKFIIKFFNIADKNVKHQNKIIDYLYSKNIPVAKIIKSKNREEILKFKRKNFLIQEFVGGQEGSKNPSKKLTTDISTNLAKMHKALLKFNKNRNLDSSKYKKLIFPKAKKYSYIKKLQSSLFKNIKKFPKNNIRKSHIHGDISNVNFIVKNNKLVAFIDWGEAHYGYMVYDIATFIAQNFIKSKKIDKDKIKLFITNYEKTSKLNIDEKKFLYYLIKYRLLIVLNWYTHRMKEHKIKSKEFISGIDRSIDRIKEFYKVSLNEFLNIASNKKCSF